MIYSKDKIKKDAISALKEMIKFIKSDKYDNLQVAAGVEGQREDNEALFSEMYFKVGWTETKIKR